MSRKEVEVGSGNSNTAAARERRLGRTSPPRPPPDPSSISQECLSVAEEAGEQVLNYVHPTLDSEERRTMVVDYVQHLVKTRLNCEVVLYGSVPLKTYLPDGDIDLTVVRTGKAEESLAREVLTLLQGEEQDENSEYDVKDTQFIDAEVKLVKCIVRGTVIDISFNQLGGLSTLCFLEQVDRRVGRNHLFKRSIILVKTWCYYESRILGAHYGLISTYALETLILYIFQHFHSSMDSPLAVLYRFLDYYSRFDWENYCISLKGPVYKCSLPDIVVKIPEKGWQDLLLKEDFLEKSLEMYSISPRGLESCQKIFQTKHLNIIDPLKDYNNLGRSVNRGNFYRIKSALKYGARKLGQILLQPKDKVADEICKFFSNTCERYENDYRNRLRHLVLEFDIEESLTASLSSPDDLSSEFDLPLKSSDSDFDNNSIGVGRSSDDIEFQNGYERDSIREVSLEMGSDACFSTDGFFMSGHSGIGDRDSFETSNSTLRNGLSGYTSSDKYSSYLSENLCHKPQHLSLYSSAENGRFQSYQADFGITGDKFGLKSWLEDTGKHVEMDSTHNCCAADFSSTIKADILENSSLCTPGIDSTNLGGESKAFNPLADLTGDYDTHVRSMLLGYLCHRFASEPVVSDPPSPISSVEAKQEFMTESNPLGQNNLCQMNAHKILSQQLVDPGINSALLSTALQFQGKQRSRGTGTYFPQMIVNCTEKPSNGRGRNKGPGNHSHYQKQSNRNGLYRADSLEYRNNETLAPQIHQGQRKLSVGNHSSCSVDDHLKQLTRSASCKIEFGSVGNLAEEVLLGSTTVRASTHLGSSPRTHGPNAEIARQGSAGNNKAIRLKNEEEFPPLCL